MMNCEKRIGNHVDGRGRGLFKIYSRNSPALKAWMI